MTRPKLKLEDLKIGMEVSVAQLEDIFGVLFFLDSFVDDAKEIGIGTLVSIDNSPDVSAIEDKLYKFKNFDGDSIDYLLEEG